MIKISLNTDVLSERAGDKRALEIMAEAGFDCVDFNLFTKFGRKDIAEMRFDGWLFQPKEDLYAYYKELKNTADSLKIGFGQTHSPYPSLIYGHPETDAYMIEAAKRCIEITAILDCPYIVIHPAHGAKRSSEEWFAVNMEFFGQLAPVAKANNVGICLENMFCTYTYGGGKTKRLPSVLATPEESIKYIDTLNERYGDVFSFCYDVGHGNICCKDHADFIKKLGKRLTALHIHDNNAFEDQHTVPYFGTVDWECFCTALKEVGYKGTFNLEADDFILNFPTEISGDAAHFEYVVAKSLVDKYGL